MGLEILGRLNAKTQPYQVASSTFGSLSMSDIAAATKGLGSVEYEYIRARYLKDQAAMIRLRNAIFDNLFKDIKKPAYRIGLSLSLVVDCCGDNICQDCDGRGEVTKDNVKAECSTCSGTGRVYISGRKIAATCGMDHANFLRRYQKKYNNARIRLESIGRKAERMVLDNLKD